ncbi:MAG: hypothetical protein JW811_10065 [Clostridiales bacterium]|nr:hypothetical protein [Clostridiales bacterium]
MTVDELSALIAESAERAAERLDRVVRKISSLGAGGPLKLELNTSQAEERLASTKRSYRDAISELKSLKALSGATYEQELAYLQAIREGMSRYRLSAGDALDLEQRLAAVQAQIMRRDAQSLDTLLSGIMEALAARYETMRGAELSMLSQSREAWQAWKESSTNAIQAQIDALDELARAEDRAKEEEKHLRGIEKLSQALEYEQDAFNRGQLAAQLSDAQAAYEAWLKDTAREDEKTALRAQLEVVNARAEAELDALDRQADAVREAYAKQLETAAIRAEAEKRLAAGTQEDILSLITAFAPEYNAAGQTLGEQMLAGFAERAGSIAGWMESLNAMILNVQQGMNAALQNAADSFYSEHAAAAAAGVTITQQNTFNTPVESPSETAWRIRQANEELAAELLES